jgi:hypothetical protein
MSAAGPDSGTPSKRSSSANLGAARAATQQRAGALATLDGSFALLAAGLTKPETSAELQATASALVETMRPCLLRASRVLPLLTVHTLLGPSVEPAKWIFVGFYGPGLGGQPVSPTVAVCREHFGPHRATGVFGWVFAAHIVGAGCARTRKNGSGTDLVIVDGRSVCEEDPTA